MRLHTSFQQTTPRSDTPRCRPRHRGRCPCGAACPPPLPGSSQPALSKSSSSPPDTRELFDDLASFGYQISSGDLGENVTTRGLQLERLPLGTLLRLGSSAVVE